MLHLFEATGLEIEYMLVDRATLDVAPKADEALSALGPIEEGEVELGPISWSNELALHVVELKGSGPLESLSAAMPDFDAALSKMDAALADRGLALMPSAMHPWMDPLSETKLWPYGQDEIYRAFDRIFDCRGHGWSNLQSVHVNLPFAGDAELGRLHAAIRLVLPILPALAASSPVVEGQLTGRMDNRLFFYQGNARRVPSVSGVVIPEAVFDRRSYESEILERIYADLAAHDPEGILQHEWANARGAIVRFDRMAIEIRVLDTQEHLAGDLAVAEAAIAAVKAQVDERFSSFVAQKAWDERRLYDIFARCAADAEAATIEDTDYLAAWGIERGPVTAGDLWRHVVDKTVDEAALRPAVVEALQTILRDGTLARRITHALPPQPSREDLGHVYRRIAACLPARRPFIV